MREGSAATARTRPSFSQRFKERMRRKWQFAYARADLGQQFWPEKLDGLGMQRGLSDENHASMGKRSAKPRLAGPTNQRLFRRRCAARRECGSLASLSEHVLRRKSGS